MPSLKGGSGIVDECQKVELRMITCIMHNYANDA